MIKQNVIYPSSGLSFNHKKERNLGICHNWMVPENILWGEISHIQGSCGVLLCIYEISRHRKFTSSCRKVEQHGKDSGW